MKIAVFATLLAAVGIAAAAPAVNNAQQKRDDTDITLYYSGFEAPFGYDFGDCMPLRIDGEPIVHGMVSQTAKCYFFTDGDCLNELDAAPLIVPADVDITNFADFTETVAESATCYAFV